MAMTPQVANMLGEQLYVLIRDGYDAVSVQACKDAGMYSEAVTAGKMTGMILEGHEESEVRELLLDPARIAGLMFQCVEVICDFEKRKAAAAAARRQPEKAAWSALVKRR